MHIGRTEKLEHSYLNFMSYLSTTEDEKKLESCIENIALNECFEI